MGIKGDMSAEQKGTEYLSESSETETMKPHELVCLFAANKSVILNNLLNSLLDRNHGMIEGERTLNLGR